MGCDIHAYIDFDEFITNEGDWYVSEFAEDVYIGRNYTLFTLMAGVRYDHNRMDGQKPLFQPKGLPQKVSWRVNDRYTLWVTDQYLNSDGACSVADAEGWVRCGISEWANEDHTRVTHPDWHSASWLTVAELEQVQAAYAEIESPPSSWYQSPNQPLPEGARATGEDTSGWRHVETGERTKNGPHLRLSAIIAAMKALDGNTPGRSRLVFWFDN